MKNLQRGEIATAITLGALLIIGVSSLISSLLINKSTQTKTKAEVTQACTEEEEGEWKFECTGNQGGCHTDAGEALAYRCEGGEWKLQYPECQNACKPGLTKTPDPACTDKEPGEILNTCLTTTCDRSGGKQQLLCVEQFCDEGKMVQEKIGGILNPTSCATPTPVPQSSGTSGSSQSGGTSTSTSGSSSSTGTSGTTQRGGTTTSGTTTNPTTPPGQRATATPPPTSSDSNLCISYIDGNSNNKNESNISRNVVGHTFCSLPEGGVRKTLFTCVKKGNRNIVEDVNCADQNKVCEVNLDVGNASCVAQGTTPPPATATPRGPTPTSGPEDITYEISGKVTNTGNADVSKLQIRMALVGIKEHEWFTVLENGAYTLYAPFNTANTSQLGGCRIDIRDPNGSFIWRSQPFSCPPNNPKINYDAVINYSYPTPTPTPATVRLTIYTHVKIPNSCTLDSANKNYNNFMAVGLLNTTTKQDIAYSPLGQINNKDGNLNRISGRWNYVGPTQEEGKVDHIYEYVMNVSRGTMLWTYVSVGNPSTNKWEMPAGQHIDVHSNFTGGEGVVTTVLEIDPCKTIK